MSDAIRDLRNAQRRNDVVRAAQAVLRVNGPDYSWRIAAALRALRPVLDPPTRAQIDARLADEPQPEKQELDPADEASRPVTLVAVLSLAERERIWGHIARSDKRTIVDAAGYVSPPLSLVPEVMHTLFDGNKHSAPKLQAIDSSLARYNRIDPATSRRWFLAWIGTTGRLINKIEAASEWTVAVLSPVEASAIARMITHHPIRPWEGRRT